MAFQAISTRTNAGCATIILVNLRNGTSADTDLIINECNDNDVGDDDEDDTLEEEERDDNSDDGCSWSR